MAATVDADTGASLEDLGGPAFRKPCGVKEPHNPDVLQEFMRSTGARIGGGACGTRPSTTAYLRFLADHARSKGTVFREVPEEWLRRRGMLAVQTLVEDKDTYLTRPDLGRVLSEASLQTVRERYKPVPQVLIVLSDGLSTDAVLANADEIVPPLTNGLRQAGFTVGDPLFLRYGRVKAEDRLGEAIGCDVVLMLVGERPGLGQSESMSCYGVYRPTAATLESDRSVISNIHREGTPPVEAAAVIVDLVRQMMQHKASGIALNKALNPGFSG
ncbi:MAG TPA: ethanolamine ammonia-lyase subunit EutC [Bilophila wadsworthia]|uniref:ethanolamine ammonia-lyase subunit EutC n=1 Tax=Bilophila wadsworthia TaxID=35833 RepID=UPI001E1964DB|nr:ethanolamine ammonia-lyase subunit EutC [Bilophila wadsworthia]MCI6538964.1 ethanolamine ammonia-lyase subunit EutC [Bilophila wadsworthia]MDR3813455.1 ethanolamine ammonia-lyase subunit EutC [Bilophila sp.]HJH14011.1 ethanolamine ammonia-lyase subunit EutC [Bilophila wadsworthia]